MIKLKNHLRNQTSPYLLQHVNQPVNWYPWCEEAFAKAKKEDKPIFLSIGYSTCHWCHVMAHESFEDEEVAQELNQHFISIKVDKEERPDIDQVYMEVCMLFTGSGGWPTSVFLTPEQKPFFAGTYFPKLSSYQGVGFLDLLQEVHKKWKKDKNALLQSAEEVVEELQRHTNGKKQKDKVKKINVSEKKQYATIFQQLSFQAMQWFERNFDEIHGGFGDAPKFPMPHNLMFLMEYYQIYRDDKALEMAEKTLIQMYRGGMFDHIGGGFSRYSTDEYFLVPHFEKMLYDNALLLISYTQAFAITKKEVYQKVVRKTAQYILREMTSSEGGFYSAQDADSEGVEGKYYVFAYQELTALLGSSAGKKFNEYFHITKEGNFEGKNIPNRLSNRKNTKNFDKIKNNSECKELESINYQKNIEHHSHSTTEPERLLSKVYAYRKHRHKLHLDDKILTSWNGLMIVAFANIYRVFGQEKYLWEAKKACDFLERKQIEHGSLFVSYRLGKSQGKGFLNDYAFYIWGLIEIYRATLDSDYLYKAIQYCKKAVEFFYDKENGGFFLYGKENETLIAVPKETYDGAIPSGNSVMTYNLVKLWQITGKIEWKNQAEEQLEFLSTFAQNYPAGQTFFLFVSLLYQNPPEHVVCVLKKEEDLEKLKETCDFDTDIIVMREESTEYQRINDSTTLYICNHYSCKPPVNL